MQKETSFVDVLYASRELHVKVFNLSVKSNLAVLVMMRLPSHGCDASQSNPVESKTEPMQ